MSSRRPYKLDRVAIRMVKEPPLYSSEPLRSPEAAVKVIADMLRQYDREAFCIVNLRNDLSPINMNIVSTGTLNASLAHPREILKSAVLSNASATMLFHNHPSGNLTPSQEDVEITDRMSKLFAMAEMPLLDHIIIGNGDQYYSFKENSIMPIGTQMFARDPAEIKFENVAEPVVSEKRGSYHTTPEQRQEKIKQITDKLEQGVHQIFESDNYRAYLSTMAKFHSYSLNNTILIAMQKPGATLVAGYTAWQKDHDRHVKKGEKGIQIIAPSPYKVKQERDALDPKTGKPQMDAQGNPLKEIIEVERPAFKVATVFDISQTEGKELPSIGVNELSGGVEGYDALFDALKATCPVPIAFEDIPSGAKGYYHTEEHRIALQEGMSQMQTVKTLIHEMSHERMHSHEKEKPVEERLSRRSMEVEAESVAFVVGTALSAEHPELKLDFSDYSFGYIAGWSSGKETAELKASLGRIQATASEMISEIEGHLQELQKSEQLKAVDEIDQKAAAMEPVKISVVAEPSVIDKPSILANLHKEMPKAQKPAVSKGKEECL
jgi:antirestriction protein ArdC